MFPYFLHEFGGIWLHDGPWSQSKGYISRETRLSPKHEKVGAEPHARVLGTVVCMDQCSNVVFSL